MDDDGHMKFLVDDMVLNDDQFKSAYGAKMAHEIDPNFQSGSGEEEFDYFYSFEERSDKAQERSGIMGGR